MSESAGQSSGHPVRGPPPTLPPMTDPSNNAVYQPGVIAPGPGGLSQLTANRQAHVQYGPTDQAFQSIGRHIMLGMNCFGEISIANATQNNNLCSTTAHNTILTTMQSVQAIPPPIPRGSSDDMEVQAQQKRLEAEYQASEVASHLATPSCPPPCPSVHRAKPQKTPSDI